ncbi:hypothetical protein P692DRAFT_20414111 [Suillus brevipes Sb2]|nr:hypothetical protein P692DRAFT_20414111 [Suillus brevipes Sb2]
MSVIKNYVCSAQAGCNKNFTKYTDLKRHEAAHSISAFHCRFAGCDFVTLSKASFEIHSDRHTGKQRYSCPHDCDFKTHNPAALTRHRKSEHGHVPRPRRVCARGRTKSASAIDANPLRPFQAQPQPPQPQVWLQPQPQPLPQPQFQFQFQPQPQPLPQPQFQFQLQPQPQPYLQFQPQPPAPHAPQQPYQYNHNHMLGVFNDRPDIVQYYTAPVGAANGWQAPAAFPPHQYHNNPLPGVFYDPGPAYPANGYAMYAAPAANGWPAGHPYRPQ